VLAALALVAGACGDDDDDAADDATDPTVTDTTEPADADADDGAADGSDPQAGVTGSITVDDQTTDGTEVLVDSAVMEGADGWIVIHDDDDGAPGDIVGWNLFSAGERASLLVNMQPIVDAGTYWAMLHVDDPADGQFTFPDGEGDPPLVGDDGTPVMDSFELDVELVP
jgi:hypothetical protein